jgi:3-oxoacyl-[acyl-carrier protein] reductase
MPESQPLSGKVALVTGAGRGIGRAIALAYAQAGATLVCAARTQREIDNTADQIRGSGGRALAVPADVTDPASVANLFAVANEQVGNLNILVINAGGNLDPRSVEESDPDGWRATLEVNLFGAYYCAKAAIPYMKERGGKMIMIGSGMGHKGATERSAYCCSKAALWMLTRVLAQELWPYGISVNELIPGPVNTTATTPSALRGNVFNIESEWVKEPEDVVPLALFLATQPDIGPTAQSFSLMRRDI